MQAANQFSRKQELEYNQFLQQLNQLNIVVQDLTTALERRCNSEDTINIKKYNHSKMLDLKFQKTLHSSFML